MKKFFNCFRLRSTWLLSRFAVTAALRRRQQRAFLRDSLHVRQTKHADVVFENSVAQTRVEHVEYVDDVAFLHNV